MLIPKRTTAPAPARVLELLRAADAQRRITAAITAAEADHRGEVRVHVELRCPPGNAQGRARTVFMEQRLDATRDGTGLLLYVAVADRQVAIWAGPGIFASAGGESFWRGVTSSVAGGFGAGRPVEGLEEGLAQIGAVLRRLVPGADSAGDELPNTMTLGGGHGG